MINSERIKCVFLDITKLNWYQNHGQRKSQDACSQVFIEGLPGRRLLQRWHSPKWKALILLLTVSCHPRWWLTVSVDGSLAQCLQGLQPAWIPHKAKVPSPSATMLSPDQPERSGLCSPCPATPLPFPRPGDPRKKRLLPPFLETYPSFPRTFSSAKWRHLVSGVATSRTSKSLGSHKNCLISGPFSKQQFKWQPILSQGGLLLFQYLQHSDKPFSVPLSFEQERRTHHNHRAVRKC